MKRSTIILFAVFVVMLSGCNKKSDCGSVCMKDYTGEIPLAAVETPVNGDFYKEDGSFCAEKALEAYFSMMKAFHYPIPQTLRDQVWTADFLSSDFAKIGMGGIFWINESGVYGETGGKDYDGKYVGQKFGYLGHDIYLLPGQAIPEHHHIEGVQGYGPKMEAWRIINGTVTFYGEYNHGNGEKLISELPKDQQPWGFGEDWFRSTYYVTLKAGDVYVLKDPESWHFQEAGENGAIVSEYATYHNHVSFSKPGMEFASTEAIPTKTADYVDGETEASSKESSEK